MHHHDHTEQPYTIIKVQNPVLEAERYTTYEIDLETNDPCYSHQKTTVRRRYSEFIKLRNMLIRHHPCVTPPSLPRKHIFRNRFDDGFIERRRMSLAQFLRSLISIPIYLSNKAVHLFMQSNYSMDNIKDIIDGTLNPDNVVDEPHSSDEGVIPILPTERSREHSRVTNPVFDEEISRKRQSTDSGEADCARAGKKVSFCTEVVVAQVYS